MVAQGPFINCETGRCGAPLAQGLASLAQTAGEIKWAMGERASYGVNRTNQTDQMIVVEWNLDRTSRNVDDSSH